MKAKYYIVAFILTVVLHEIGHLLMGEIPFVSQQVIDYNIEISICYELITMVTLTIIPSVYIIKEVM